jgi:hypothetical protein
MQIIACLIIKNAQKRKLVVKYKAVKYKKPLKVALISYS